MLNAILAVSLWLGAAGSAPAQNSSDEAAMTVRAAFEICAPMVLGGGEFGAGHPVLAEHGAISRGAPEFLEGELEVFEIPSPSGPPVLLTLNLVDGGCELEPSGPFLDEFRLAATERGWIGRPTEDHPGLPGRAASWFSADHRAHVIAVETDEGGWVAFQQIGVPPETARVMQDAFERNTSRTVGAALIAAVDVVCPAVEESLARDLTEAEAALQEALLPSEINGGFGSGLMIRHRPSQEQVVLVTGGICIVGVQGGDPEPAVTELRGHLDNPVSGWSPITLTSRDVYRHADGRFLRFLPGQEGAIVGTREAIEAFASR